MPVPVRRHTPEQFQHARGVLKAAGLSLQWLPLYGGPDKYRVGPIGLTGKVLDDMSYLTEDLEDALNTGLTMAPSIKRWKAVSRVSV